MSLHDFGCAVARAASQAARPVLPVAFTALLAANLMFEFLCVLARGGADHG